MTKEDIEYYQKIVGVINETIRIMSELVDVIQEHGGWPLEGSDEFELPEERDEKQTGLFDY